MPVVGFAADGFHAGSSRRVESLGSHLLFIFQQHAQAAEGDALLAASDSGVAFVPRPLAKRDARTNKAAMRQLHGYAPTDDAPDDDPDAETGDGDGDLDLGDLDEFG